MSEVSFFGLFAIVGLLALGIWIWGLVDALRRPQSEWERAGQSQILWVLLMVFLGVLGTLLYALIARPRLNG